MGAEARDVANGSVNLVEIFSSAQGEGLAVGASTVFVRFGGCDLRCRWCDSPHTWNPATTCRVETRRGGGGVRELPNPVAIEEVVAAASALQLESHRFLSLTGGEPLLQPEAAGALARRLRGRGPRIHLETHGIATAALESLVADLDLVAMDWKLASDVRRAVEPRGRPGREFHDEHEVFLRVARRAPEVVVKVVVSPATETRELDEMAHRVARVDPGIPVVLQPVSPQGPVRETPPAGRLLAWQAHLERTLRDVRLIPQTHKAIGAP